VEQVLLKQACDSLRASWRENDWLQAICDRAERAIAGSTHGDLPRWREALMRLPPVKRIFRQDGSVPLLGSDVPDQEELRHTLMQFHPWRKGPLVLGGLKIDTEWRSDWKWERMRKHFDFAGKRVLDIGCGNGYFGWRMLAAGARLVAGIDPTLVFVMQWLACRHFAGDLPNYVLPLGIEELPAGDAGFDTLVSMGVLYHRRDHGSHLKQIRSLLGTGGTLVMESLVLTDDACGPVLVPRGRYARMRNVHAIPCTAELLRWVRSAGFESVDLVDVSVTSLQEQRSTEWMRFESLQQALDPEDAGKTLEGYPAPTRALLIARC